MHRFALFTLPWKCGQHGGTRWSECHNCIHGKYKLKSSARILMYIWIGAVDSECSESMTTAIQTYWTRCKWFRQRLRTLRWIHIERDIFRDSPDFIPILTEWLWKFPPNSNDCVRAIDFIPLVAKYLICARCCYFQRSKIRRTQIGASFRLWFKEWKHLRYLAIRIWIS